MGSGVKRFMERLIYYLCSRMSAASNSNKSKRFEELLERYIVSLRTPHIKHNIQPKNDPYTAHLYYNAVDCIGSGFLTISFVLMIVLSILF